MASLTSEFVFDAVLQLLTDGALAKWEASLKQRGPPSGEFLLKSSRACPLGAPELLNSLELPELLTPDS